jgi:thiamine pyrophosphokinase
MENTQENLTVIVADGAFPTHEIPLSFLKRAGKIICCDGSSGNVVAAGFEPFAIVGDMDSLDESIRARFSDRIFVDSDQETNDLTKAVKWCAVNGFIDLVILGATGKREDHTLGNISLLAEYARYVKVKIITDTGMFLPFLQSTTIPSLARQQISIFSIDPQTEITSAGLVYPLKKAKLSNWWTATLNEAIGECFSLEFNSGRIIVFIKFPD